MIKTNFLKSAIIGLSASTLISSYAIADDYEVDLSHSFIEFSTQHLGISVLKGRFNDFAGSFTTDEDASKNSIEITVQTKSIDSNWAARDKHLRNADFLDVEKFPTATFKSTKIEADGNNLKIMGDFTLHGVTKTVTMMGEKIAEGKDPWGGYRAGYKASFSINRSEYGVDMNLGPQAEKIDLELFVEGIRK